jgi:hypothetical protein
MTVAAGAASDVSREPDSTPSVSSSQPQLVPF